MIKQAEELNETDIADDLYDTLDTINGAINKTEKVLDDGRS